jgi:hypothetical protein
MKINSGLAADSPGSDSGKGHLETSDLLIELSTGTLFSFPADWRRQILKIVLVLELVLVLDC